jgi:hypothetical protein
MTRPPLSLALSLVLAAAIDGAGRPALLATLHPELTGLPRQSTGRSRTGPGLAQVIPLPRVIPMPRRRDDLSRAPEQHHPEPDPTPAA